MLSAPIYTRPADYKGWKVPEIPNFIYRKYPRLRVALAHRIEAYNKQLEMLERLEDSGDVICIRPIKTMEVGRIEKDATKLEALYEEGFKLGDEFCKKGLL
jgi:predicted patatin/cPLA2 family phospholipase